MVHPRDEDLELNGYPWSDGSFDGPYKYMFDDPIEDAPDFVVSNTERKEGRQCERS